MSVFHRSSQITALLLVFLGLPGCTARLSYGGLEAQVELLNDRESQLRALSLASGDPQYARMADETMAMRLALERCRDEQDGEDTDEEPTPTR